MPYVTRWPTKRIAALGAVGVAMLGAASPALAQQASQSVTSTSQCTDPALTQPFLAWGDTNSYALMPGESPDSFTGQGWTLSGGASIAQATLADGSTGSVLVMPAGSTVVTPTICVSSSYPTARTMILGSSGVFFYVSYDGTNTWNNPQNTGQFHGASNSAWSPSDAINLQTSSFSGWTLAKFTFVSPQGTARIYNFYVDPYAKR